MYQQSFICLWLFDGLNGKFVFSVYRLLYDSSVLTCDKHNVVVADISYPRIRVQLYSEALTKRTVFPRLMEETVLLQTIVHLTPRIGDVLIHKANRRKVDAGECV